MERERRLVFASTHQTHEPRAKGYHQPHTNVIHLPTLKYYPLTYTTTAHTTRSIADDSPPSRPFYSTVSGARLAGGSMGYFLKEDFVALEEHPRK